MKDGVYYSKYWIFWSMHYIIAPSIEKLMQNGLNKRKIGKFE